MDYETPAFRRLSAIGGGIFFVVFAISGVAIYRHIGAQYIGVVVPAWWYAVTALPPGIATIFALLIPTRHRWWHRRILEIALGGLMALSFLHIPLIYALYDFEHPRATHQPTTPSRP
jgi:hypothetical protein